MLAAFKEYILPFLVYGWVIWSCFTAATRRAYLGFLTLAILLMLPQLWYPTQSFPLATQTLTLLTLASLFGAWRERNLALPEDRRSGLVPRGPDDRLPFAPSTGLLIVMMLACGLALANVASKFPSVSLELSGENTLMANWKNYLMMLSLYFVGYGVARNAVDIRRMVLLMLGMVIFLAWRELAGFLGGMAFSATHRSVGPFWMLGMNANHFAAFIAHISVIALGIYAVDTHRWRRRFYLATFLASLYPLFFSYSRGAYAAVVIAIGGLGVLKYRRLLPLLLIFGLFWDSILPDSVVERVQSTETEEGEIEDSAAQRLVMWQIAQSLFQDNPVFGIGFSGFFFATEGLPLRNVHNYFLQTATEQGLVGLAVLTAFFVKAWIGGWKLYRHPRIDDFQRGVGLGFIICVVAVLITNLFGDRFSQLSVGGYLWLMFGLVDRVRVDPAVQALQMAPEAADAAEEGAEGAQADPAADTRLPGAVAPVSPALPSPTSSGPL